MLSHKSLWGKEIHRNWNIAHGFCTILEEGALFSFVLLLNSESVGYLEILFTEKPYLFSPVIRSSACSFPLSIVISSSFRIISRPR